MGCFSIMSNSFGCSASGERLVSAARDGDLLEAKALLDYNPRLARYSTFGVRNSPLHYSAAQGHHEIVFLLLKTGVDIDLRNIRGQTALMLACQFGHWEVVQTLVLFKANIHRTDYLNGGTALHFAALNGHARSIRLLLADYVPSIHDFWKIIKNSSEGHTNQEFDEVTLFKIVNKKADGGITPLHMAALNGHAESVLLLLDLGASFSEVTVEDGTTIDLIGAGSTALHYAACGGKALCCQVLIARGASLEAENANGLTPLMIARTWHRNGLEGILSQRPEGQAEIPPSPYLSLPLESIIKIARECRWEEDVDQLPAMDPCAVCLERKCEVAADGCGHEFCTRCALYLCSTNSSPSSASGLPGSIACPLCRQAIVSFSRLLTPSSGAVSAPRASLSLSLCACPLVSSEEVPISSADTTAPKSRRSDCPCVRMPLVGSSPPLLPTVRNHRFALRRRNPVFCMGTPETTPCLRFSRQGLQRSASQNDEGSRGAWLFPQHHPYTPAPAAAAATTTS